MYYSGEEDGFDMDRWMESFFSTVSPTENSEDGKWREVRIDVGAALAEGYWSGNVDVKIFARANLLYDTNSNALVGWTLSAVLQHSKLYVDLLLNGRMRRRLRANPCARGVRVARRL